MARLRHASNPAKVKAQYAALEGAAAAEPVAEKPGRAAFWLTPVLALAGAGLLLLSFTPFDCWPLAYVALAPWTLALIVAPKRWWGILWCFLAGAAFFSAAAYWVAIAEGVGYLAMEPYLWLYFLAAAIALGGKRGLLRQNIPAWIALPVVWVALEYARAWIISGFPWFYLGHTQYRQIRLIQIADLTSDYGVSFFVAMVNGAIVDLVRGFINNKSRLRLADTLPVSGQRGADAGGTPATHEGKMPSSRAATAVLAVLVTLAGLLGYGTWRLRQAQTCTHPGPVIGLVQLAFGISLDGVNDAEKVFDDHVSQSESLAGNCQLVVWPETMLPKGLNVEVIQADLEHMKSAELYCLAERFLGPRARWENDIRSEEQLRLGLERLIRGFDDRGGKLDGLSMRAQARRMGDLSKKLGCPVLAGGAAAVRNPRPMDDRDLWITQNCALWFDGDYKTADQYAKVHLVPFGEYVPFKYSWPGLHKTLRWFVPPVMEQIEPGTTYNHFTLKVPGTQAGAAGATPAGEAPAPGRTFRIATPICYEGAFARVCRAMVYQDGAKSVDLLANMSNDGWFTWKGHGTTEQAQHLSLYVFRAIENRVPVVRAVNTGISASVDSCGRIVASIEPVMSAGTLLLDDKRRNDVQYADGHGPIVLVDDRLSGYDLAGDLFAQAVALLAACLLIWAWWKSRKPGSSDPAVRERKTE
jgi:apolipoprotein N-acyltransferase